MVGICNPSKQDFEQYCLKNKDKLKNKLSARLKGLIHSFFDSNGISNRLGYFMHRKA